MRHRYKRVKLGKPYDQRKALIRSLLIALITQEKIKTTYVRAKELSRWADRLVTLGKRNNLHSRRQAYRLIQRRELVKKLFDEIAPRFKDISGGYVRVVKADNRRGDNALMAIVEFTKIKEEIFEEKKKLRAKRREKKQKQLEEEIPEVKEVEIEEEKVKIPKKKARKEKKSIIQEKPLEKEGKKEKEPSGEEGRKKRDKKEKKGFLEGLKGFLKGKKEK